MKSASAAPSGPVTHGKGLDALERFIIQSWPPSARFSLWSAHAGALVPPKSSLERFFNEHLQQLWSMHEDAAVITIDPAGGPFVLLRVEDPHKHRTPEAKYKPAHWVWKVVTPPEALPVLDAARGLDLPPAERDYLEGLKAGPLNEAWETYASNSDRS